MAKYPCLAIVLALGALGLSIDTAKATFIPVPPAGANFELVNTGPNGANAATLVYNAATETLTANVPFGPSPQPGSLVSLMPFASLAHDIIGDFSLTATIDHSGAVLGGTFSLTGHSATIGILAPTTLLSGKVQGDGSSSGIFQMSGAVTSLAPDLQAVVGPIDSSVLDFISGSLTFTSNFSRTTASESPDIFLVSMTPVPEPASALLFAGAVLAVLAFGLRRRLRTA